MAKVGNPYHDAKGLFTSSDGANRAAYSGPMEPPDKSHPGVSKASQDKNRAIKKAKKRLEQQKAAPHLKRMSDESLRQLAKQQLASPHPSLAKPTVKALSQRFHITRNGVIIDTQNPDAGIASNLRMELGQRGMRKR